MKNVMLFNQIDYHYKQKKMEVLELNECFWIKWLQLLQV